MKRTQLDLSEADGFSVTEDDLLRRTLRRNCLYRKHFLYTVVDAERLEAVLENGTHRTDELLLAFSKKECVVHSEETTEVEDLDKEFRRYRKPAILVYNGKYLEPNQEGGRGIVDFEYRFLDPSKKKEALLGIVEIFW